MLYLIYENKSSVWNVMIEIVRVYLNVKRIAMINGFDGVWMSVWVSEWAGDWD